MTSVTVFLNFVKKSKQTFTYIVNNSEFSKIPRISKMGEGTSAPCGAAVPKKRFRCNFGECNLVLCLNGFKFPTTNLSGLGPALGVDRVLTVAGLRKSLLSGSIKG